MKKTLLALTIASSLTPVLTLANQTTNNVDETENMIVTANRTSQSSTDLLSSVKVISRVDINLSSANSVAELLNDVNGLQMSQSGGAGQTTSIFSRGTNAGHTLVIIDGQRISSATLGQTNFANISVEQIERIEVIKGPRAALWGSDAIGGVIQIFTRQLAAGEIAADLGFGNMNQKQLSVSAALAHGDGSTTFTASAKSSDGYDVFQGAEDDDDGYNRESLSFVGQQAINTHWQLNWLAKYNQGESDYDNAYGGANESSFENQQWQLSASQDEGDWNQNLFIGQQINESRSFGNGIPEKDGTFFETTRLQASWLVGLQLTKQLTTNIGFDFIDEKVDSKTPYDVTQRDNKAAFARFAFDNDTIILDGALRYDDIEGVDSEVTYNLSAGFRFAQNSLVSLNFGSGFKAPSFNDLYFPNNGLSYGNPDLVAETSDSIELLIKSEFSGVNIELSIFDTEIENLIEWQPDANFAYHPVNVNKAEINGAELTLDSAFLGLNHQVQLSYLDAKDSDTNEPLIRRAKHTASYQVSKSWEKLNLLASVNYLGEREDSEWPGTVTLPSHTLVNVSAAYQVTTDWSVALKVNNLFDKDYVTNNNYTGQPAQYLFTVSYRK
ncbi:TonB-dependent receptor domain-containing protein [Candidatus Colwellia aromaticivorans]|uniref:TonB-dependent receptor domain-containing protein n=1 Tax=Candidatus Colwellia aromaticivorans TaxID=2267621 RepID=UPI001443ED18|nr:TonB-dependent receptor [Candidatus Colwellia aromaticivorans]